MEKNSRLKIFHERLEAASPASTHAEAYTLIQTILNAVEDEHSGVPNNPQNWQTDGRLYPPQIDSVRKVYNFPWVLRYRSSNHNTFIASNGAIEVRQVYPEKIECTKRGADGKGVWDAESKDT
ncbi:MAG: hypothetical protein SFV17_27600 [Candidatus Obscuribacter sp.]|nr:hypothetical protein [Candidatus Obscuribacter sp.]